MIVAEFQTKLHELVLRCDVTEDPNVTLSRFRIGLRPDIKKELLLHLVHNLDHSVEIERSLKARKFVPQPGAPFHRGTVGTRLTTPLPRGLRPAFPSPS